MCLVMTVDLKRGLYEADVTGHVFRPDSEDATDIQPAKGALSVIYCNHNGMFTLRASV